MRNHLSTSLQTPASPGLTAASVVDKQQIQESPALPFKALLEMYLPQDNTQASALPKLQTAQMKIYQQARAELSAQITRQMTARRGCHHGDGG
ncbi:hypothetical protein ACO0LC_20225 [Undibacterium sp. JH2W]|uniref:hypothetical protein n=1 Tax=Undibacterium sp. JH2W TaxID=3413037 RepID=UPI003BEF86A1